MYHPLLPVADWGLLRLALTLVIVLFAGALAALTLALEAWRQRRVPSPVSSPVSSRLGP